MKAPNKALHWMQIPMPACAGEPHADGRFICTSELSRYVPDYAG